MLSSNAILFLLGTLSLTDVGGILPVNGQNGDNQAPLGLAIGECQTVVDCGGGPGVLIRSPGILEC